jgi:hypothetical protein
VDGGTRAMRPAIRHGYSPAERFTHDRVPYRRTFGLVPSVLPRRLFSNHPKTRVRDSRRVWKVGSSLLTLRVTFLPVALNGSGPCQRIIFRFGCRADC